MFAVRLLTPSLLGVIPVTRDGLQRALALLPYAAALFVVAFLFLLLWFKRRRLAVFLESKPRRKQTATVLLIGALGVTTGLVCLEWGSAPPAPGPANRGGSSTAPWLTFMGNHFRTGSAGVTAGPRAGEKLWHFSDGVPGWPFAGSPAVSGNRVYVGSDSRKLYCLDALTGEVVWEFKAAYEVFASPVVAGGRVFVGEGLHYSEDSKLYCLDAVTGQQQWAFQTGSHIEFSPTLYDGRVTFCACEDGVYCVDPESGQELWHFEGVHADVSPVVSDKGVFFGNIYGKPNFWCLDRRTGQLRWKRPAPYGVCGTPSTDGERVCFGLGNGTFALSHAEPRGSVWCLSASDGSKLWEREVGDAVLTAVALTGGKALFGSRDGLLYCVEALTGEVHWSFDTEEPVLSSPAVTGGRAYFGSNDGHLYCVSLDTGEELWKYDTSQVTFSADARVIASPAVASGRVYVGSMNHYFLCLGDRRTP